MRFVRTAVIFFCAACAFSVCGAAEVSFSLSASSGDNDFDLTLHSINSEAQQSLPSFYSSMDLNFGVKQAEVDVLLYRHRLSPAEAYMAIRLSVLIGKPVDYVLVRYHKYHKKGWGYIAKKLGIKPGSAEFHRLKEGGVVVLERSRKERQPMEVRVKDDDHGRGPHGNDADRHEGHGGGEGKGKGKR